MTLASWKKIWSIAWPHSIENILFTLLILVDLYWVGQWGGDDPINAVSLVGPILWTVQAASFLLVFGLLSMISRCVGRGDKESAVLISHQGLLLGIVTGLIVGISGVCLADPFLLLYETTPVIHEMAVDYMVILFAVMPIFYLYMALYAIFSAHGNTLDPMLMSLIAWIVNFILDPMMILGWGGIFPVMGIQGAALSTLIAHVVALVGFFVFFQKPLRKYAHISSIRNFIPHWPIMKEIIRIGTPASINGISRPLTATILMSIVSRYGKEVVAAFGICVRVVSINWIYLGGLNIAVSTLVGQNLGATSIPGAQKVVSRTMMLGILFQIVLTGILLLFSQGIVSWFSPSEKTILEASYLLSALAIGTLGDVYIAVYGGALNGAGDTTRAMFSSVFANWIYKLPMAFLVYYYMEDSVKIFYWGITLSLPMEGLMNYIWYKRGAWTTKKIKTEYIQTADNFLE